MLTVQAPEASRPALEAVARSLPPTALPLRVAAAARWPWSGAALVQGSISEEGGCACSLLAEDADWEAPFWAMRDEVLGRVR